MHKYVTRCILIQRIQASQIHGTLQVTQSRLPALTVRRTRQVSLYVNNGLQRCLVFIRSNVNGIVYQSGIVAKVYLSSRYCRSIFITDYLNHMVNIILVAAFVQQLHARTDMIIATFYSFIQRVYKVRPLLHIVVISCNGHIIIGVVSLQFLRTILPGHRIIYGRRTIRHVKVSGVLRKGGIDHRSVSVSHQARTTVGKERIIDKHLATISRNIQAGRADSESTVLQGQRAVGSGTCIHSFS